MTDEEMAEEYAEKHSFRVPYDGSNKFYDDTDFKASKDGFLAGLKAGRPQWHDLRKAPTDLPPLNTNVLVIHRWAKTPEIGKRIKVFINSSVWVWAMCSDRFRYTSDDENVIAWCEIPVPPKESE